jgi:hypothetical protein
MSDSTISLNPDQQEVLQGQLREVMSGLQALGTAVKPGNSISKEYARDVLYLIELTSVKIGEGLGVETDGAKEIEERFAAIRAANERVRALEEQLGKSQSPTHTKAGIQRLCQLLEAWWRLEGFGHVSDLSFRENCCKASFSCNLFGNFSLLSSDTPVSDKTRRAQWIAELIARGFDVSNEGRDDDDVIMDTDKSRSALLRLFETRFPGCRVASIGNRYVRDGGFAIRDVCVYIYDYEAMLMLPQAPADE